MENKFRFVDEYYNFKVRGIKNNGMMNPGIKREILRRMERAKFNLHRGYIVVDEYMRLLSNDCCYPDEDMSEFWEEGWTPYSE